MLINLKHLCANLREILPQRGKNLTGALSGSASGDAQGGELEKDDKATASSSISNDKTAVDRPSRVPDSFIYEGKHRAGGFFSVQSRSVRLGSYKAVAREKTLFTQTGIQIRVPDIRKTGAQVVVNVRKNDVMQIMAHFNKNLPIIFLYISPSACAAVRAELGMERRYGLWLDLNATDETMRRVTILPDRLQDEHKQILKQIYNDNLEELDSKKANELLVRSSPKDAVFQRAQMMLKQESQATNSKSKAEQPSPAPVFSNPKLCQYPAGAAGAIHLNMDDYSCLEDESFLNDTVIEFYFRWLQHEIFGEVDRARTHVFATYFYNKLTKRPARAKNKVHPIEDNPVSVSSTTV